MILYTLSQQVEVATGRKEWMDIETDQYEHILRDYAKKIKKYNPNIVLSLRSIEEKELNLFLEEKKNINEV